MPKYYQSLSSIIKTFMALGLIFLSCKGYSQALTDKENSILQGSIHIQSATTIPGNRTDKIQPGTPIKINVNIENEGQKASPLGQIYVRYAYTHPLDHEKSSVIFETEKKPLLSIEPGQHIEITFDTLHQTPSLNDFIRYDWPMREYQVIAIINQEECLLGSLALTFSAYYYPGIKKEFPTKMSSLGN